MENNDYAETLVKRPVGTCVLPDARDPAGDLENQSNVTDNAESQAANPTDDASQRPQQGLELERLIPLDL